MAWRRAREGARKGTESRGAESTARPGRMLFRTGGPIRAVPGIRGRPPQGEPMRARQEESPHSLAVPAARAGRRPGVDLRRPLTPAAVLALQRSAGNERTV